MDPPRKAFGGGLAGLVVYGALAAQTAGSAAYLWLQPRGFAFGSRGFFERQVIVPAVFLLSISALAVARRRPCLSVCLIGILAGFWLVAGFVPFAVGNTVFARAMVVPWFGALIVRHLALRSRPGDSRLLAFGCAGAGMALGAAFWIFSSAPPPTTRPSGGLVEAGRPVPGPPILEKDGLSVRVEGSLVVAAVKDRSAWVRLAPEFVAVSDSGIWSIFQFRSSRPSPWKVERIEGDTLDLWTDCADFTSRARASIENGKVRLRVATTVRRDIPAHLATALTIQIPGDARIEGRDWNPWGPAEFVAFRRGRMEFLRARRREKGPFETLASWPPHDPIIQAGGWKVQVVGWADQASRAESPTAGWGVSQGAIERWGNMLYWNFASTSIGRGWHTVRTGAGTYGMEVRLDPP